MRRAWEWLAENAWQWPKLVIVMGFAVLVVGVTGWVGQHWGLWATLTTAGAATVLTTIAWLALPIRAADKE